MAYEPPSAFVKRIIAEEIATASRAYKNMADNGIKTGTVIMSFLYGHGIMIGADRQVTGGSKIVRNNFSKIVQTSPFSAISFCGQVVMAQAVSQIYKRLLSEVKFRIDEVTPLHGQIEMIEQMMLQLGIATGFDSGVLIHLSAMNMEKKRPYLLEFYDDGSAFKPDSTYISEGSGGTEARTTLKNHFKVNDYKKLGADDAARLALTTIQTSSECDAGVGDPRIFGATLAIIDADNGFSFIDQKKTWLLIKEVCK